MSEIQERIRNKVEEQLANELENIPVIVHETVQNAVLSLLGLRRNGSSYEVDTFNKDSPLRAIILETITDEIRPIVSDLAMKELKRVMEMKSFKDSMSKEIAKDARRNFSRVLDRRLDEIFSNLAEHFTDQINVEVNKMVETGDYKNCDLFDPEAYEGKLGELVMKHIVDNAYSGSSRP